MHYLCSVLSGDASHAVNHLAITDSNFSVAWSIISLRYENRRRLISTHLQLLFSLPQITSETSKGLQTLRDQTNAAIQALKNLGRLVDRWDDIIVYFVVQKLDKASRKAWELKLSDTTEFPPFPDLDRFLDSRIRALDAMLPDKSGPESETANKKSSKPKSLSAHATNAVGFSCPLCKKNHLLYQCSSFVSYAPTRRFEFIKSQMRCYNCLAANYLTKDYKNERRCRECMKKHHTLLHAANASKSPCEEPSVSSAPAANNATKTQTDSEIASHTSSNTVYSKTTVLLATARVRVSSMQGRFARVRALLDQGSAATLISENLAQLLRLPRIKRQIRVTGIGDSESYARHAANIRISPASRDDPAYSTTAIILKSLMKYVPRFAVETKHWSHTANLPLADDEPFHADPIDILLGADIYSRVLLDGVRKGRRNEPIAQNTTFGWILCGPISPVDPVEIVNTYHGAILNDLDFHLRRFWEVEDIPQQKLLTAEEQQCEEHFLATHSRSKDGRYIVRLPFKTEAPAELGDSRSTALKSLHRLEHRLAKNPTMASQYAEFLAEYESLAHMITVNESQASLNRRPYYIPHHAVYRESSTTTRLRVVFNASSQTTSGRSLNDYLLVGPKLQTDLAAVILQWRQFQYVFTADIAKMYRQILVDSRDTDYQRILWRSSPSVPVQEYRLRTVTYGTTSAPFLVLRQLAVDEGAQFPLALPVLNSQIYVDDCTFGADEFTLARQTRDQLVALLKKGGFHLRKWASNCPALLEDIDPSDHGLASSKDMQLDDAVQVLGIAWHPHKDVFHFRVSQSPEPGTTKRQILSTVASLFDPLGWVAPVVITAKILIQQLWSLRCYWDDEVPVEVLQSWHTFHEQLPRLRALAIPRWMEHGRHALHIELHGFADASTKAYAAAVYLRVARVDSSVAISLLVAKSKVAPLKTLSVPRLELCAALLLARLLRFARSALQRSTLEYHCWTDSSITLAWLSQSPSRWKTFVATRVAKIQALVPGATWRHVPTQDNPADCASRGLQPDDILRHPLWWSGPGWLKKPSELWPLSAIEMAPLLALEARVAFPVHDTHITAQWDLQSRVSSWPKLLRITAFIMRFVRRLKERESRDDSGPNVASSRAPQPLSPSEIHDAKIFWLKSIQADSFSSELAHLATSTSVAKSSSLVALNPYLDADSLIRVRGRLAKSDLPDATKNPIILKSHPLVALLISDLHTKVLHAGPQLILARLRQEFWLLRARATVRSILYWCVPCARERALVPEQLMGELPLCRVRAAPRSFVHTGVDYAGPILVQSNPGRGHKSHKSYIALFVCMTTKAIHLELVSAYSSGAFIAAYHRFVSRRGLPTSMYSDNGTTFQGADRELATSYETAVRNPDFTNRIATEGVAWHFLPPAAPHFGGLWEAVVRRVKHHLRRCVDAHRLTFEELSTFLCKIEACQLAPHRRGL